MARVIKEARVEIVWDDGHRANMGTVTCEASDSDVRLRGMKRIRQRFAWEMIRAGFRVLLPGKEWRTKIDAE